MEEESRKRSKRVRMEKIVLKTIATAGLMGVALLAPHAMKLLKKTDPDWLLKRDPRRRVRESVYRLKHKGLVEFQVEGGKKRLRLTSAGERAMNSIWNNNIRLKAPRKWDGKWRMVIFDIPEKKRGVRDRIRNLVSRLGFMRLQDSVWVYPYDCEELVALLKTDLKIGRAVLYVIADAIEFDKPIRMHFKLPLE